MFDVEIRIRSFLYKYNNLEKITIISHQAPQLALEVICNNYSWEFAFAYDWRSNNPKKWQTHWEYFI